MALTLGTKPIIPKIGDKSCLAVYLGSTKIWPTDKLINSTDFIRGVFSNVIATDNHYVFVTYVGGSTHAMEFGLYNKDLTSSLNIYVNMKFFPTFSRNVIRRSFTTIKDILFCYSVDITNRIITISNVDLNKSFPGGETFANISYSGSLKNVVLTSNEDHLYVTVFTDAEVKTYLYNSSGTQLTYNGSHGVVGTVKNKLSIGTYYFNLIYNKVSYTIEVLNSSLSLQSGLTKKILSNSKGFIPTESIDVLTFNDNLVGYGYSESSSSTKYYIPTVSNSTLSISSVTSTINSGNVPVSSYLYNSGGRLMFEVKQNVIKSFYFSSVTESNPNNINVVSNTVNSKQILNKNDNQCYAGGAFFFNTTEGAVNLYA